MVHLEEIHGSRYTRNHMFTSKDLILQKKKNTRNTHFCFELKYWWPSRSGEWFGLKGLVCNNKEREMKKWGSWWG
jgi:hypothetical protein